MTKRTNKFNRAMDWMRKPDARLVLTNHNGRPDYWITGGCRVEPEIAKRIIAHPQVIGGKDALLPPLTDEEREQRRIEHEHFLAQSRQRAEQQRLDYEQERFALAEAERLESEQRAAIARSERTRRLQDEMREQSSRQMRDRQLSDLHQASIRNETFRNAVVRSQAHANARQRLKSILYPPEPQPLPEPEIDPDPPGSYFGEPGFSVELWSKRKRNRSWW